MTTARIPVRIRLELTRDRADAHLLDQVREAVSRAATRAVDRARTADALDRAVWSGRAPEVSVRFHGDPVPEWAAAPLDAGMRAVARDAAARLRLGPGDGAGPAGAPQAPAAAVNPGMTVTPITMARQLRRLASPDELSAALDVRFAGAPVPPRLLVMAADVQGVGWMLLVEREAGGGRHVQMLHELREFTLPAGGGDAETARGYGGWQADSLNFIARADTEPVFRRELTGLVRRVLGARHPGVPAKTLDAMARERAGRYPWTGKTALYEFRYGGTPVNWYRGPARLTETVLPVVTLTEETPAEPPRRGAYGGDCPPLTLSPTDEDADPGRPFLHELALEDWDPEDYDVFAGYIDTVVYEIGVPRPRFVGSFILATLAEIGRQCENLGLLEGTAGRQSALGRFAKGLENLNSLLFAYTRAMLARDRAHRLPCPLAANSGQWATHLHRAYFPLRRRTVAALFVTACQDALLEVLERSAAIIADRLVNKDWLPPIRMLLTDLLADLPELDQLRSKLRQAKQQHDSGGGFGPEPTRSYRIGEVEVVHEEVFPGRRMPGGGPMRTHYRIRDAKGAWITLEQVEDMLKSLRSEAFRADPFLEKLADIPSVVRRLRMAQQMDGVGLPGGRAWSDSVDREFLAVLGEIRELNRDHTWDVRMDRSVAYGLATFEEGTGSEAGARLSGVHQVADKRLRAMFADKELYDDGVRALAAHEVAKGKFNRFWGLVGLSMLAVFFPEVAFVVGVVQAGEGEATARDHAELQRSMLGGDEILSRAQVEAELAVAHVQLILAIVPELPAALRGGIAGTRALARRELSEASAVMFRRTMGNLVARLGEATVERLTMSFLTQLTTGYVLELALSEAIGSFAESVAAQYRTTGTVPQAQLRDYIRRTMSAAVDAGFPAQADTGGEER